MPLVASSFAQARPTSDPPGQAKSNPPELRSETAVEGEILAGRSANYSIELKAGQFARITAEQRGINLALIVTSPDGTILARADEREDTSGVEQIAVLADAAAIYQLEIKSFDDGESGRFRLSVAELREPTALDRLAVAAERETLEATRLLGLRTAESRRLGIKKYEAAAMLFHQAGESRREATSLAQIGMVHGWLGEVSRGQDYFERARALQHSINNTAGEARALSGSGQLFSANGEWQKALDLHQQALALRRTNGDPVGLTVSLSNIGEIYAELGEPQKALEYYQQAREQLSATGSLRLRAKLLSDTGQVYETLNENQRALDYYEQALAGRRQRNNRGGMAVVLHRIGLLQARMGRLSSALKSLQDALEIQQTLGNITAANTMTSLGEVYYRKGELALALEYLNRATALRGANADGPNEALNRFWVARVFRDQGDVTGALKAVESAVRIIENLRGKIASHELRASYFATVEEYYELYIDLLMQLYDQHADAGYAAAALSASESARARSLVELLREARTDIRRGVDPALLEREHQLQAQLNAKADEQAGIRSIGPANPQAEKLSREVEAVSGELHDLEVRIKQTSPRYAALVQPQPLRSKEIQQLLDPQTLLLEFKLGEERSYLWVVSPTSITSLILPKRAQVELASRDVYRLLTERNRQLTGETLEHRLQRLENADAEYLTAATRLSQMLLGAAAPLLENKRLLIVGDGALHYLPFGALPAPPKLDPIDPAAKKPAVARNVSGVEAVTYLMVDHEIVNLPSASMLAELRAESPNRKRAPKLIAVLADPVFDQDDVRVKSKLRPNPHTNKNNAPPALALRLDVNALPSSAEIDPAPWSPIPRLPFSRREAAAILASAPAGQGRAELDFSASRATATGGGLAQYRYVHFATHGLLNSSRPELSGIVLSLVDEHGNHQDGFLRLHEIYNLDLPADLVVLSACQTGLGKEIKGEGLVGLTRGFMYAGAARVAASLWKVDDAATAELMGRFYLLMLKKGYPPTGALRQTQIEMAGQKRWRSPYYWAAFTIQGDWQ
ncbi:MAG: CHAT domain-containing protein [Pyrinomonadaceae bacterium]